MKLDPPIDTAEVRAYRVPAERTESDGTFAWDATTLVVVRVEGGGARGLGYTYGDQATATVVREHLLDPIRTVGAMDVTSAWSAMVRATRNLGRPGIASMEPSCAAVFKDELVNLLPHDQDARRLQAQTHLLGEFLSSQAEHFRPPRRAGRALLQGHCHQKAIMGLSEDRRLLERVGLEVVEPEAGCCGMAGAFGFGAGEHYDVSVACAERALLPAVRAAAPETLIVADGFSCREQIAQTTDREAMHLAQVLHVTGDGDQHQGPRAAD